MPIILTFSIEFRGIQNTKYACKRNIEAGSRDHCCRAETVLHILSVCL
jgi:hypothetical protein